MTDQTLDLCPLEEAAGRAGLPGLKAQLVPPDRRRGRWFTRRGSALLVNERVVERLGPPEGQALLVNTVLQWKHLAVHRRKVVRQIVISALMLVAAYLLAPGFLGVVGGIMGAALIYVGFVGWSRAMLAADDESVELLGEPEILVRALNTIHKDTLALGNKRIETRPDVHRRAERLVNMHQLRVAPEQRTVPVIGSAKGCQTEMEAPGDPLSGDGSLD
jgi:hypothetical protein